MPLAPAPAQQQPPQAGAPLLAPQPAARAFAPAGTPHPDEGRAWVRDGAQMSAEMHHQTKPYLDALMRVGRDFKTAHADGYSKKQEAKLLKRYNQENPLSPTAGEAERAAHQQGAEKVLADFKARLEANVRVHGQTRDLRNEFKGYTEKTYGPDEQARFEQRYAELCQAAGRQEPSPLEQALPQDSPLRTKLDPLTGGLRDPSSGLFANMVKLGEGAQQKNVLIFGGTGVGAAHTAQVQADLGQFVGGVPKAYHQAAELTAKLRDNMPGTEKLETAGHSLGGGLAHYAALKTEGVEATCFNAAALGGGCRKNIDSEVLKQAKDKVRHINVLGDAVGDGIGQARVPLQKLADDRDEAALRGVAQMLKSGTQWAAQTAPGVAADLTKGAAKAVAGFVGKQVDKRFGDEITHLKEQAAEVQAQVVGAMPEPLRAAGGRTLDLAADAAGLAGKLAGGAANLAAAGARQVITPVGQVAGSVVNAAGEVALAAGGAAVTAGGVAVGGARKVAELAQAGGKAVAEATAPAREAAGRVGGAVLKTGTEAAHLAGQGVKAAAELGSSALHTAAQALPEPVQNAGQQVLGAAATAKKSVREMLQSAKSHVKEAVNTLKQGAQGVGKQASAALAETKLGELAGAARQQAVKLHENLGLKEAKLAIPHQYGSCITLDNGGKNNPLGNHVTGALTKAYARHADQHLAVKAQVSLGQQRQSSAHHRGI